MVPDKPSVLIRTACAGWNVRDLPDNVTFGGLLFWRLGCFLPARTAARNQNQLVENPQRKAAMNISSLLNKARKELEIAKVHADHDGKTATAARQTAVAAKKD